MSRQESRGCENWGIWRFMGVMLNFRLKNLDNPMIAKVRDIDNLRNTRICLTCNYPSV